ncbi:MAG: aspartyl protease family protein [Phycisphaerales bacterium]|nr:aspartyl protease family protein [Phycisphaerales bacterium]
MPRNRTSFISLHPRTDVARPAAVLAVLAAWTACAILPSTPGIAAPAPIRAISQPPTADEIVAKVRAALGISALAGERCLKLSASGSLLGAPAESSLILDASGRFARHVRGPIEIGSAFDGKEVWTRDLGGEISRANGGDRRDAMFNAYTLSAWYFSPASKATITLDDSANPADMPSLVITTDHTRPPIKVSIDPATWLPRSWKAEESGSTRSIDITEWREQSGLKLPAKATLAAEGLTDSFELTSIELLDRAPDGAFAKPSGGPTHASFDASIPALLAVERAPTGHLLVKAAINGQDCGWFIFDTGAGINCVSKVVVEKLALTQIGAVPARGVGGVTHSPLFRPDSLAVGPMTLHDGLLMQLDLSFLTLPLGREIGGIIGFGFLMRSVSEVDMGKGSVALYDPENFKLDGAAWTEIEITDRVPVVRATFDTGEGRFRLDTGANTALTFHAPTVERMKLLDNRKATDTMLGGVGGAIKAKAATLDWFTIGGQRLDKLTATFALENKGAFANPDIDGNIGAGILRNFKLVFDYPHERMAFIKR